MVALREIARHAVLPSAAAWLLESKLEGAVRGRLAQWRGRKLRADVVVALNDPYSLLALDVVERVFDRVDVEIDYRLVWSSALGSRQQKMERAYAVLDASRMAELDGAPLARTEPLCASAVERPTLWLQQIHDIALRGRLLRANMHRLWRQSPVAPDFGELYALYVSHVGHEPPADLSEAREHLRANRLAMGKRGQWETPVVDLEGRWFFAHEREQQMRDYLGELGQ